MTHKKTIRNDFLKKTAKAYYELLTSISELIRDDDFYEGIKEGLTKFPSNYYISLAREALPNTPLGKYLIPANRKDARIGMEKCKRITDYYSKNACKKLENSDNADLEFEHMIPKNLFQDKIIGAFRAGGEMSEIEIRKMFEKYWYTATITDAENNARPTRTKMPKGSADDDRFARYQDLKSKNELMTQDEFFERLRKKEH